MSVPIQMQSGNWNCNVINSRFVLGGGITGPTEMTYLVSAGVTHVISAAAELDDTALCVPATLEFYHVVWNDDGQMKPEGDFANALGWVTDQDGLTMAARAQLPRYYVHCAAGVNRGPTLCSFLMAALSGDDLDAVWATIVQRRTVAGGLNVTNYRSSVEMALNAVRG